MDSIFSTIMQDARYAIRTLYKSPGFTITAILSLALGIGANTAIFSLIDAVLLKELPVRSPGELTILGDPTRVASMSDGSIRTDLYSYAFYERLRDRNQVFSALYATGRTERLKVSTLAPDSQSSPRNSAKGENAAGRFVTGNFFEVLGIRAAIGRTFTPDEDRVPGQSPVVVISNRYWERRFARDPQIAGREIRINGSVFTIIGVTPPLFQGDIVGRPMDLWIPISMQAQANPGRNYRNNARVNWLLLMGRRKPDVSESQVRAALDPLVHRIAEELLGSAGHLDELRDLRKESLAVSPGAKGFSRLRRDFSFPLFTLMGVVAIVLLISCANVANLQLARAAGRSRKIGLRLAVGAGQWRLMRQLVTESLLLSLAGGAVGILFAAWGVHLLLALVSSGDALPVNPQLGGRVLLFTAGVSIVSGLLFGVGPALQATRLDVISSLKETKSGNSQRFSKRAGKVLIVSQVALSVLLIICAGLFVRTLGNLQNLDVGFARDKLLLVEVDPAASGYQNVQLTQLASKLLDTIRSTPGVSAVSVSENGLFSGTDSSTAMEPEGFTAHSEGDREYRYDRVGPDYFDATGTPLIAGRGIETQDVEGASRVVVINQAMSEHFFGDANPIGRHMFFGTDAVRKRVTIIGLARDAKQNGLRRPTPARFYLSYFQAVDTSTAMIFEVRTSAQPAALATAVREQISGVDPNLQILDIKTARLLIDETLDQEKLIAKLSSFFGLLALLLATVGLYGVMSYITARRTAEVGVRMALGADGRNVVGMVLGETLQLAVIGIVIGVAASVFASHLIMSRLYGLSSIDPLSIFIAVAVIAVTASLAGYS